MFVYYNNDKIEVKDNIRLEEVIAMFEIIEHKAVWVNGEHVPLSNFKQTVRENDHIKVVRIRGGG